MFGVGEGLGSQFLLGVYEADCLCLVWERVLVLSSYCGYTRQTVYVWRGRGSWFSVLTAGIRGRLFMFGVGEGLGSQFLLGVYEADCLCLVWERVLVLSSYWGYTRQTVYVWCGRGSWFSVLTGGIRGRLFMFGVGEGLGSQFLLGVYEADCLCLAWERVLVLSSYCGYTRQTVYVWCGRGSWFSVLTGGIRGRLFMFGVGEGLGSQFLLRVYEADCLCLVWERVLVLSSYWGYTRQTVYVWCGRGSWFSVLTAGIRGRLFMFGVGEGLGSQFLLRVYEADCLCLAWERVLVLSSYCGYTRQTVYVWRGRGSWFSVLTGGIRGRLFMFGVGEGLGSQFLLGVYEADCLCLAWERVLVLSSYWGYTRQTVYVWRGRGSWFSVLTAGIRGRLFMFGVGEGLGSQFLLWVYEADCLCLVWERVLVLSSYWGYTRQTVYVWRGRGSWFSVLTAGIRGRLFMFGVGEGLGSQFLLGVYEADCLCLAWERVLVLSSYCVYTRQTVYVWCGRGSWFSVLTVGIRGRLFMFGVGEGLGSQFLLRVYEADCLCLAWERVLVLSSYWGYTRQTVYVWRGRGSWFSVLTGGIRGRLFMFGVGEGLGSQFLLRVYEADCLCLAWERVLVLSSYWGYTRQTVYVWRGRGSWFSVLTAGIRGRLFMFGVGEGLGSQFLLGVYEADCLCLVWERVLVLSSYCGYTRQTVYVWRGRGSWFSVLTGGIRGRLFMFGVGEGLGSQFLLWVYEADCLCLVWERVLVLSSYWGYTRQTVYVWCGRGSWFSVLTGGIRGRLFMFGVGEGLGSQFLLRVYEADCLCLVWERVLVLSSYCGYTRQTVYVWRGRGSWFSVLTGGIRGRLFMFGVGEGLGSQFLLRVYEADCLCLAWERVLVLSSYWGYTRQTVYVWCGRGSWFSVLTAGIRGRLFMFGVGEGLGSQFLLRVYEADCSQRRLQGNKVDVSQC